MSDPQQHDFEVPISAPPTPDMEEQAALAYQTGGADSNDPMMQAIRDEISGGEAVASSGYVPLTSEMLQPYQEGEVFRAHNLTKSYGSGASYIEVIKGVSFIVNQGEYIIIYGPSGSGKSTLLHMLAGLEPPSRGEIRIHDQPLNSFDDDDLALYHREDIGLVFQSFNLLPSLTAWENVAFPLMLSGAPAEWRRHEAMIMLQRFGMDDFAGYYPGQLSGGQQQRVAMARALIHNPELLLIDEPTGNLDSRSADQVIHEIDRLHKEQGRTIVLVTHSQVFLPFATRVFYIHDGILLISNDPRRIHPPE
jgi:putative ABC transport system ATP-binding protein